MATVLEMSVQFLRLAGSLVPSREPHAVSVVQCGSAPQGVGLGASSALQSPAGRLGAGAPEFV